MIRQINLLHLIIHNIHTNFWIILYEIYYIDTEVKSKKLYYNTTKILNDIQCNCKGKKSRIICMWVNSLLFTAEQQSCLNMYEKKIYTYKKKHTWFLSRFQ